MRAVVMEECYFTLPAQASDEDCADYWFGGRGCEVWVLEENGQFLGSYYLRQNHYELGEHIANAGYLVPESARGRGIGRMLAEKSIERAKERGFRAIQFNFVISTNAPAMHLWEELGWRIIGTVPGGYHEKHARYVDAHIMLKELT